MGGQLRSNLPLNRGVETGGYMQRLRRRYLFEWMLMLLLFVGGVMNFAWIAGIALFVLVEKLSPAGHWIGRGAGVLLVAWGGATLLAAS